MARLLDFGRGRFYGLDEMSALMLTECLGGGSDAAVARITAEFEVDEDQARRDVEGLLDDLQRQRLLAQPEGRLRRFFPSSLDLAWGMSWLLGRASALTSRVRYGRPSVDSTLRRGPIRRLLALTWVSLRVFGWSGSVVLFRSLPSRGIEVAPGERPAVINAVDRSVRESGAATFFLPAACKERALVGYRILEGWYGLPAAVVVGVRRQPFLAHAWVECDGRVVTDDIERCEPFTPVLRIGPASEE